MIRGGSGGTLGPLVWFFCACLFYLLPVIWLDKYIGLWAWPAGIAWWVVVAVIYAHVSMKIREKDNNE